MPLSGEEPASPASVVGIAWFRSRGHRPKAGIMSISCWLCSLAAKVPQRRASLTPSVADTNGPSPASAVGNAKGQHYEHQLWTDCACISPEFSGEEPASRACWYRLVLQPRAQAQRPASRASVGGCGCMPPKVRQYHTISC